MARHPAIPVTEKCLSTWVPEKDYLRFCALARLRGVTVSEMLRAVLADVLAEEDSLAKKLVSGNRELRISA